MHNSGEMDKEKSMKPAISRLSGTESQQCPSLFQHSCYLFSFHVQHRSGFCHGRPFQQLL